MTSPSLRNLRITRLSIAQPTSAERLRRAAAVLLLLLTGGGSSRADEAVPVPLPPGAPGAETVDTSSTDVMQGLRKRSSTQRWSDSPAAPGETQRPLRGFGSSGVRPSKQGASGWSRLAEPQPAAPRQLPSEVVTTESAAQPAKATVARGRTFSGITRVADEEPRPLPERPVAVQVPPPAPAENADPAPRDPFPSTPEKGGTTEYSPSALKRVTTILPYADYEPDPKLAADDPCRNLCPRPEGCPGKGELCPSEHWTAGDYVPRMFGPSCFTWTASNLWYNPLYFEDVALERYGHSYCEPIQPFVSVGRFGAQLVTLPYHMGIDPPCKKEYALGYYRPGECAPKLCYQPPLSLRGGLVQAGVMTGLFFAIP